MILSHLRRLKANRMAAKAEELAQKQQWDEAAAYATLALKSDDRNIDARMVLGVVCFNRKDYESALRHYRDVLVLRPGHRQASHHLALAHARLKQWNKAAKAIEQPSDDSSGGTRHNRAAGPEKPNQHLRNEAPRTAGEGPCNTGGFISSKRNPAAERQDINRLIAMQNWPAVKASAQSFLEQQPDNPSLLMQLAMACYKTGDAERALELYNTAEGFVAKESDKAVVQFNRATTLMQLERWDAAGENYERLLALPEEQRAKLRVEAMLYSLAYCYRRRKMIKMARTTYEKLYEMNPDYKDVRLCVERLRVPLAAQVDETEDELQEGTVICPACMKPLKPGAVACSRCGWSSSELLETASH